MTVMTPVRYLPKRVASLMRQGALPRKCGRAAALFCYFEEHEWLLYSGVSTNFPKGYKVQSSPKLTLSQAGGKSQMKPPKRQYLFLRAFLVEGLTFVQCAIGDRLRAGETKTQIPSQRTLHREAKVKLRQYLEYFAKQLEAHDAVDHSGKSP